MCGGANFLASCGSVQKRVFATKNGCFCLCHFYVGESQREKKKNLEKVDFEQKTEKQCFWLGKQGVLLQWLSLEKYPNTIRVRKVKKARKAKRHAFSLTRSVFGKCHFFRDHRKSPNATKIGASAGTGANPRWKRGVFGRGLERGFL